LAGVRAAPRCTGIAAAQQARVLSLVLLGVGVLCALIGRVLLVIAACRISLAWTIGLFLPFGPTFFRLNYPEEARSSAMFRLATLPCIGGYLLLGGVMPGSWHSFRPDKISSTKLVHYATEKPTVKSALAPSPVATPSLEARRAANQQELARLQKCNDQLRLRKRDLLHSDVQGNREYVVDLALYNEALAKATTEHTSLAGQK
jgi:hypothetical protein